MPHRPSPRDLMAGAPPEVQQAADAMAAARRGVISDEYRRMQRGVNSPNELARALRTGNARQTARTAATSAVQAPMMAASLYGRPLTTPAVEGRGPEAMGFNPVEELTTLGNYSPTTLLRAGRGTGAAGRAATRAARAPMETSTRGAMPAARRLEGPARAVPADLPPVQQGFQRLWRGQSGDLQTARLSVDDPAGRWFTPAREYAESYVLPPGGMGHPARSNLYYVDVPQASLPRFQASNMLGAQGRGDDFILPVETVAGRRRVPDPRYEHPVLYEPSPGAVDPVRPRNLRR